MKYLFFLLLSSSVLGQSIIPKEFTANFEESMISAVSGKEIKSSGVISYKYPSLLRLEVLQPEPSTVVVGQKQTWIFQPPFIEGEKGQVTIEKRSTWPLLKTFDSLATSLSGAKDFTHKYQGENLTIDFTADAQNKLEIKKVILQAPGKKASDVKTLSEFETMLLVKTDGKEQKYKFSQIKIEAIDSKQFIFNIPKNTKVIKN